MLIDIPPPPLSRERIEAFLRRELPHLTEEQLQAEVEAELELQKREIDGRD